MPLDLEDLSRELERRAENMRHPEVLLAKAGRAGVAVLREHFRGRGGEFWPSFAQQDVTHLGEITETSATILISPTGDVPYGAILFHKVEGGDIVPKPPRKLLAIPTKENPEPKKWPSMYEPGELVALWGRRGPYALCSSKMLARIDRLDRKKSTGREKLSKRIQEYARHAIETDDSGKAVRSLQLVTGARIVAYKGDADKADLDRAKLFILTPIVHQVADPDALPSSEDFTDAVIARLDSV